MDETSQTFHVNTSDMVLHQFVCSRNQLKYDTGIHELLREPAPPQRMEWAYLPFFINQVDAEEISFYQ